MDATKYIKETPILDYSNQQIQDLIKIKKWVTISEYDKIGKIYHFVQNDILFGYNKSDEIPASIVLKDGYGQCNTKSTLFMALLRAVGIACRFHGFTIDKQLQKGAIRGVIYKIAPPQIIHSWVEVFYGGNWVNLEGFILDLKYLNNIQKTFPNEKEGFCGFGIATTDFKNPEVEWTGKDTYIQKEGIKKDFGLFDDPDSFYQKYGSNLSGVKKLAYKYIIRKMMNANVNQLREN